MTDMTRFNEDTFSTNPNLRFSHLADFKKLGIWEYNAGNTELKWSDGFYQVLGYQPGEIPCTSNFFFENILYHKDKTIFFNSIEKVNSGAAISARVRLLTKKSGYKWFESIAQKFENQAGTFITGLIIDIDECKQLELQASRNNLTVNENFELAKTSNWEIEIQSQKLLLSAGTYALIELKIPVPMTVDELISFFEPAYRPLLNNAIDDVSKYSKPFELELLLRTAKSNLVWVLIKAVGVIDEAGKCVTIRGIIRQIADQKKKEIEIQKSVKFLSEQNKRLQNFAYIVSHNLRSHTGNLSSLVNLFEQTEDVDDRMEIFTFLKSISDGLTTTIDHLNEIIKVNIASGNDLKVVSFKQTFETVLRLLSSNIKAVGAVVEFDFSKCAEVDYIPAYLESIFQNFLTNALKYRHPDRTPVVHTATYKHEGHIYLTFEDNGLGFDLKRYGDKVFGMYNTFHKHPEAKGIGLFITRNQVEALGGNIEIASTLNEGTKFTIKLT